MPLVSYEGLRSLFWCLFVDKARQQASGILPSKKDGALHQLIPKVTVISEYNVACWRSFSETEKTLSQQALECVRDDNRKKLIIP